MARERRILKHPPRGRFCLTKTGQCPYVRGPADTRIYEQYACRAELRFPDRDLGTDPNRWRGNLAKTLNCRMVRLLNGGD